jgi:hypothetical protein
MGSIYPKKGRLYAKYKRDGAWVSVATGLSIGQEKEAAALLKQIEEAVKAGREFGAADVTQLTVRQWGEEWLKRRRERDRPSVGNDEAALTRHVYPLLGSLRLFEVRPRHVRRFVEQLENRKSTKGGKLAPKTVRNTYGILRTLFAAAKREELIESNPCALEKGELPAKVDKDPEWRAGAVFARAELELLIASPQIPEERRVLLPAHGTLRDQRLFRLRRVGALLQARTYL